MSTTIDQRVVEMRFDNKNFESNAAASISTLDKLKKSLNLTGASKGLDNINSAAKNNNMYALGDAVQTVHAKFSALDIMGVTALVNITNQAVNAGKKIASALTIEPVKTGFQEYETQINAVQTILANTKSKGTDINDVNKALDDLNGYADKTIYNFTEMTRNIGTFTAAGVDLDKSVTSIKGIANLAAVSGSSSQQASTAMYQLSQALAAGKVSLMDWNSVVNAGMGGQVFQDALKRTAENMGYNVDAMIKKYGSFRESLTEGEWLTADVLTETLTQLSGAYSKADLIAQGYTEEQAKEIMDLANTAEEAATKVKTFTQLWDTLKEAAQSGWTQSWEIIVGDFEEAKETLTKVSDVVGGMIGEAAKARNDLLQGWKDAGGRTDLLEGFSNTFDGIMNVIKPIKEAFRDIFPPITVKQLVSFTEGFKNLTASFEEFTSKHADEIKSTFKGIFAGIDLGVTVIKEVIGGIGKLLGNVKGFGNGILGITGSLGDWIIGLRDAAKETDIIGLCVGKIVSIIQTATDKIKTFISFVKEKIAAPGFEFFLNILTEIWNVAMKVVDKITAAGKAIGEALTNAFRNGDIGNFLDIFNSGLLSVVLLSFKKFADGLTSTTGEMKNIPKGIAGIFTTIKNIPQGVVDILDTVKKSLETWQQNLKADTLLKIAGAIGILALSLVVLAMIDPKKLAISLGIVTGLFADLLGSLAIFNSIGGKYTGVLKAVTAMIGISVSVLILASALKKISELSLGELATGLLGVVGLTAVVVAVAKVMQKNSEKIMKGATSLVIFAVAIKVLASACTDLSSLSWEELAKGLLGVAALMTAVSLFLNNTKFGGKAFGTATGMVVIAAAIKILASACSDFGGMSWGEIGKGLTSIGVLLAELALFTNLTGNAKHIISTGVALVIIGGAMKIFASAMKDFSEMKWEEIGRGLGAMAGALTAVTIAVRLMPKNMILISTGLLIVSGALLVLANTLDKMGGMSWEEIGKGLTVLGGSMAILAIGLYAMSGSLAGSAALVIAAGAITLLTPSLLLLGNMSWENIIKGLVSLAGAFAVFGIAGAILGPLVPTLLAVSAAFGIFGVGVLAVGAGLLAIAAGLTALVIAVTAFQASRGAMIAGIVGVITAVVQGIGEALILLCSLVIEAAPLIAEAVKELILAIVKILVDCAPILVDGIFQFLVKILDSLGQYTPQIIDALFEFIVGVINGIADNIPSLIQSAVNLVMSFFSGVVDALKGIDTTTLLQGIAGIGLMSLLMMALAAVAALTPAAMIGVLGMGAVITELAIVLAAIGALAQIPGLSWLIGEGGQLLQSIGTAIGQFIGGIVGGVMGGITSQLPQIGTDLSNFMTNVTPFIEGAKSIDPSMMDGVKALADTILILTAANILESISSWVTGGTSISEFGTELAGLGTSLNSFVTNLGTFDETKAATVTCAANAIKAIAQAAESLPNEGGWAAKIFGDNSIASFGGKLPELGSNLCAFVTNLGEFDDTKVSSVTCAANAIKAIAEATESLPNEGGWAAKIFGDNSIASFGEKLPELGSNLCAFATNLGTFDDAKLATVKCASNAIKAMADAASNIDGQADWAKTLFGDNSLSAFGEELEAIGGNLKSFASNLGTFDDAKVTTVKCAVDAIKALSQLADAKLKDAKNHIGGFGDKLEGFAKDISTFVSNMPSSTDISNATDSITKIVTAIKDITNAKADGISNFTKSLKDLGKNGVKSFVEAFTSKTATSDVKDAAVKLVTKVVDGIESKIESVDDACESLVSKAVSAIKSQSNYTSFYNAGSYLVSGFAAGITANSFRAAARAAAMANAAEKAARDALDINSPSKVFREIGKSVPEGFAMGIDKLSGLAVKSSSLMANAAIKSVNNSISQIADAVSCDIDAYPTIRPVLDLSDIQAGANSIGSIFGRSVVPVGVLADVGSISASMNGRIQNGGNGDIVSAINKLRKDLGNVGNTSYNINGITYDDGSNISDAVKSLVRAAKVERRI